MNTVVQETRKKIPKPNNVIRMPLDKSFFKWWCILLRPIVNLTDKETEVVSSFLRHRFELSKVISDPAVLDSQLMSHEVRGQILEECHINLKHFYVVMSNLRKRGIITKEGINRRLIPNTREDDNGIFQLLILFQNTTAGIKQ